MKNFSKFAQKVTSKSGIEQLIEDLCMPFGERPDMLMLGDANRRRFVARQR